LTSRAIACASIYDFHNASPAFGVSGRSVPVTVIEINPVTFTAFVAAFFAATPAPQSATCNKFVKRNIKLNSIQSAAPISLLLSLSVVNLPPQSQRVRFDRHFVIPLLPPSPREGGAANFLTWLQSRSLPVHTPFLSSEELIVFTPILRPSFQSFVFTLQLKHTKDAPAQFHFYRAICRPKHTRPSLCTGRRDAFDAVIFPSGSAFAGIDSSRHYADVAIIDSDASNQLWGHRARIHIIQTLADSQQFISSASLPFAQSILVSVSMPCDERFTSTFQGQQLL